MTKTKFLKHPSFPIFFKRRWLKDIKYKCWSSLSTMTLIMAKTKTQTNTQIQRQMPNPRNTHHVCVMFVYAVASFAPAPVSQSVNNTFRFWWLVTFQTRQACSSHDQICYWDLYLIVRRVPQPSESGCRKNIGLKKYLLGRILSWKQLSALMCP